MEKTLNIEGMMCEHCAGRVKAALEKIDGVSAQIDLAGGSAKVTLTKETDSSTLSKAVEDAGYTVTGVL